MKYYPINIGIIISHYKDPYKPTSISWKVIRVCFVVHLLFGSFGIGKFFTHPKWFG